MSRTRPWIWFQVTEIKLKPYLGTCCTLIIPHWGVRLLLLCRPDFTACRWRVWRLRGTPASRERSRLTPSGWSTLFSLNWTKLNGEEKTLPRCFYNLSLVESDTRSLNIAIYNPVFTGKSPPLRRLTVCFCVRHSNVVILTTSNVTEKIDLAFVDRADIKQYIGPPSEKGIYNIYFSCLEELMKVTGQSVCFCKNSVIRIFWHKTGSQRLWGARLPLLSTTKRVVKRGTQLTHSSIWWFYQHISGGQNNMETAQTT